MLDGLAEIIKAILDQIGEIKNARENRAQYLNTLQNSSRYLGVDWAGDLSVTAFPIEKSFIPLYLVRDGKTETLANALRSHRCLVIQGQAGAGKSTIVQYITWVLSHRDSKNLAPTQLGIPALFPVKVCLRNWRSDKDLYEDCLLKSVQAIDRGWLEKQLNCGQVFILLDGFDEVTEHRSQLIEQIGSLTHRFINLQKDCIKDNRILVTARTANICTRDLPSAFAYKLYTLRELDAPQQLDLIQKYYTLWFENTDRGVREASVLYEFLRNHRKLQQLGTNPLMLALLAALHYQGESLQTGGDGFKEYDLYEKIACNLIGRRERDYRDKSSDMENWMRYLGELALHMHQNGWLEIAETEAEAFLCSLSMSKDRAGCFLRQAREWYFLVKDEAPQAKYYFTHPNFQEFFVAYIVHKNRDKYLPILLQHLLDDRWSEIVVLYASTPSPLNDVLEPLTSTVSTNTLLLAARCLGTTTVRLESKRQWVLQRLKERLSYVKNSESVRAAEGLCWLRPEGTDILIERIVENQPGDPILAILQEIADPFALHELREALLAIITGSVPAAEDPANPSRLRIAEALGVIRDPRIGQVIDVIITGRRLKVGKFPVTEQEYALFAQGRPGYSSYSLERANHPATNVSWYDAQAYCDWLSQQRGCTIRLPTEKEWLQIAQGGNPKRLYPWGWKTEVFDCYFTNAHLAQRKTTPVGLYPGGETQAGVSDLLGNVWEWTQTKEGDCYILKGGDYKSTDLKEVGVNARRLEKPDLADPSIGFRFIIEEG